MFSNTVQPTKELYAAANSGNLEEVKNYNINHERLQIANYQQDLTLRN